MTPTLGYVVLLWGWKRKEVLDKLGGVGAKVVKGERWVEWSDTIGH